MESAADCGRCANSWRPSCGGAKERLSGPGQEIVKSGRRLFVERRGRVVAIVVVAVLVLVPGEKLTGIEQADRTQRHALSRYGHQLRVVARLFRFTPLVPHIQKVSARWNIRYGKSA